MIRYRLFSLSVVTLISGVVVACDTPANYRPEVEQFRTATTEATKYLQAQRAAVASIRSDLRRDILSTEQPEVQLSNGCAEVFAAFSIAASDPDPHPIDPAEIEKCAFSLPDEFNAPEIFDPATPIQNSVAFMEAVDRYAAALVVAATVGDQEGFVKAVDNLSGSIASVSTKAAKAAGISEPDTSAFGPIGKLVANAAFYYLENKRAEALSIAASTAQIPLERGSEAVARVLYSIQFERVNRANFEMYEALSALNEAKANAYPGLADKAIESLGKFRNAVASDPAAAMRELPQANKALITAFDDPERKIDQSIAAAKKLYEAARETRAALVEY